MTLSSGSTRTTEAAHVLVPSVQPAAAPVQASADPFAELTGGGVSANSNGKTAPFQPNDRVLYKPPKGSTLPPEKATVLKVHWDAGDPPYYSIQLDSTGAERQTDEQRLEKFVPDYNAAPRRRRRPWIGPKCNSRPWVLASRRRSRVMPSSNRAIHRSSFRNNLVMLRSSRGLRRSRAILSSRSSEAPPRSAASRSRDSSNKPGFPQQQPVSTATTGLPTTTAGVSTAAQGFPAAPQMQMQQQQPQGGFLGGFPGQGGFFKPPRSSSRPS